MTKTGFGKTKKGLRVIALILVLMIAVVLISPGIVTRAMYDTDAAIKYQDYKAAHPIPEKMLFIGSYLIHKDALTSAVYSKALDSQSEYNQFDIYYKSEIGEGGNSWYKISGASGLSAITTEGEIASEDELKDLYVTYVVNADGTVVNAKTGAAGTAFDDPNPYDIKNLPEFKTLKAMYEAQYSDKSKGVEQYCYMSIKEFFETNVMDYRTVELDTQIKNLNTAYTTMKAQGSDTEAELIMDLMTQLDNERRSIVYYKLVIDDSMAQGSGQSLEEIRAQYKYSDKDLDKMSSARREAILKKRDKLEAGADKDADNYKGNNPTSILQGKLTGTGYDAWTDSQKSFTYNEVYDYITNHKTEDGVDMNKWDSQVKEIDRKSKYANGTLDKQTFAVNDGLVDALNTAINDCKTSYTNYSANLLEDDSTVLGHAMYIQKDAIANIAKSSSTGMEGNLHKLAILKCIRDNTVKDGAAELEVLQSELLPVAAAKFTGAVTGGVGTGYTTVQSQGGSKYASETALSEQDTVTGTAKTELESLIEAKEMRITTKEAFGYINTCITENDALKAQVVSDAYKTYADNQILNHKLWLQKEVDKLKSKDESLLSESDKLAKQKEALVEKKQDALDNGDRNLSAKYDAEIGKIDSAIKSANANAGGAGSTADSAINNMKNKALEDIANGGDGKDGLNALAAMGATDAIGEVAKEAGVSNSDAVKKATTQSKANNAAGIGNDLNGSGNKTNGTGSGANGAGSGTNGTGSGTNGTGSGANSAGSGTNGTGSGANGAGSGANDAGSGANGAGSGADGAGADGAGADGTGADGAGADGAGADGAGAGSGADGAGAADAGADSAGTDGTGADGTGADSAGTDGTGADGTGNMGLTKGDIENALESFFGGSFDTLSPDQKVVAATAVSWYANLGNHAAEELSTKWSNICASERNRYFFKTYNDLTTDYAALKALGRCTDYRYIYDGSDLSGTLAGDTMSYSFIASDRHVILKGGAKITMTSTAKAFDNTIYVPESLVTSRFNMNVENIKNSEYSALLTGNMMSSANEFLKALEGN